MLPKSRRLTAKDIEGLSLGKSVFGTLLSIRYRPAQSLRFSVAVSKKVASRAVERNKIRRRVYAAVRVTAFSGQSPVSPASIMVLPKKECLTAPADAVRAELSALFHKAGLV